MTLSISRGEQVAAGAQDQVQIGLDQRRRGEATGAGLDLGPQRAEEVDVLGQLGLFDAGALGAHDKAAGDGARGRHLLDGGAQALALGLVGDALADADVRGRRHVDDVAAGQRDVRGDARALGAQRVLGDLAQDVLALADDLADGGLGGRALVRGGDGLVDHTVLVGLGLLLVVGVRGLGAAHGRREDVVHVEEGRPVEAHVHERRLHARQDAGHLALVDVPDEAQVVVALDVDLRGRSVFQQGHSGLAEGPIDEDRRLHAQAGR